MLLKLFWVSDVDQLQGVLNSDFSSAGQIIHKELNEIEEISGLEPCLIENASFVHESELILVDGAIEVLIDFPDPLIDLGLAEREIKFCENSNDIFFIKLLFRPTVIIQNVTGFY